MIAAAHRAGAPQMRNATAAAVTLLSMLALATLAAAMATAAN